MLNEETFTTTATAVTRKGRKTGKKKAKAPVIKDLKTNFVTLKPQKQMQGKSQRFNLYKEKSLPWGQDIENMFKEYEASQHKGADQDVDTDEDNLDYGRSTLLSDLKKAVNRYQTDPDFAAT